jgi:hypothetical protein
MKSKLSQPALVVILSSLLGACAAPGGPAKDSSGPYGSAVSSSPCVEYWKDETLARTQPKFEETLRCWSIGGGGL